MALKRELAVQGGACLSLAASCAAGIEARPAVAAEYKGDFHAPVLCGGLWARACQSAQRSKRLSWLWLNWVVQSEAGATRSWGLSSEAGKAVILGIPAAHP